MRRSALFRVALVTAPDLKSARRIARSALQKRLAACANLIPGLESHYWWQGKLETSSEVLILFKTRRTLVKKLERDVLENHPYDTPEFVALELSGGTEKYLAWLKKETG